MGKAILAQKSGPPADLRSPARRSLGVVGTGLRLVLLLISLVATNVEGQQGTQP